MALHGRGYLSGWRGQGCHDGCGIIGVSHHGDGIAAILGGQINWVLATDGYRTQLARLKLSQSRRPSRHA